MEFHKIISAITGNFENKSFQKGGEYTDTNGASYFIISIAFIIVSIITFVINLSWQKSTSLIHHFDCDKKYCYVISTFFVDGEEYHANFTVSKYNKHNPKYKVGTNLDIIYKKDYPDLVRKYEYNYLLISGILLAIGIGFFIIAGLHKN